MTQKSLTSIEEIAKKKWNLLDILIVHRVGKMKPEDVIVFVAVSSKHRDESFDACKFIIDYLKVQAPFWKKEKNYDGYSWVEQKKSDLLKIKDLK